MVSKNLRMFFFFKKKFAENTCQESGFLEISKEMLQFLWEVDVSLRQLRDIVGDLEWPCGQPEGWPPGVIEMGDKNTFAKEAWFSLDDDE